MKARINPVPTASHNVLVRYAASLIPMTLNKPNSTMIRSTIHIIKQRAAAP
jgi:hypothetical protein